MERKNDVNESGACRIIVKERGGIIMKFYTIKLPKFLGGFVRAVIGTIKKE
ncbi:Stage V sporulation protein family protein [Alteribacillus persepolensis]|uniref:Stage V sporulation protein family protein n=1 Tax=Alteribacillus persepolensis TaxID=568899 RepID=A0A1G7YJA1_9BACI|nr:Stage V sporulation protein family protein [Alteribacillus persepolensis]